MSTPKRATVYFEPEVYRALRARAIAADCSDVRVRQRGDAHRTGTRRAEISPWTEPPEGRERVL